jgi:hypothetical protein
MDKEDTCIGGILVNSSEDTLVVETTGGKTMEFKKGRTQPAARGGRGQEVVKRAGLVRTIPPAIPLVDWDNIDDKPAPKGKGSPQKGNPWLFD